MSFSEIKSWDKIQGDLMQTGIYAFLKWLIKYCDILGLDGISIVT
jgi:hypothetical protein